MLLHMFLIFLITSLLINGESTVENPKKKLKSVLVELTDDNWDQMQKGQWFIGFFDKESDESKKFYDLWNEDFALKSQKFNINVGRVFAPSNPALYIRFLVTTFPKVFYIKNGVAHEVPISGIDSLLEMASSSEKLSKLKPVNFLSNPFSVQMSLLSHMFVHAVNLYNYEHSIVQSFISAPSATDVVFGLTFIVVGTFLGLFATCLFGLVTIFLMDSKDSGKKIKEKSQSSDEDEKEETSKEESANENVRKRKKSK